MADVTKQVCALCKKGEEAEKLDNISKDIIAHSNCLLFSPEVITTPQQDSQDSTVEFYIPSVISEISRGVKLRCVKCKKSGATVGCDHAACKRTYHYPCVTEAKGIIKRDEGKGHYLVYCREHANCTETSGTSITPTSSKKPRKNKRPKKRKKKMERSTARKKKTSGGKPGSETVQNAEMRHDSDDEQRRSHQLLDNHRDEEDMEVPGPSTGLSRTHFDDTIIVIGSDTESEDELPVFNGSQLVNIKGEGTSTKDDTSVMDTPSLELQLQETLPSPACERTSSISTDSSGFPTPKISRTVSLSGLQKRNRKRKRKRNNPELETALLTMNPDERKALSQLYDDVGGSFPLSEDICDDEEMEDTSNTVEDIPKDQHTGTKAKSDGSNLKIAALESSVSVRTSEGQSSSSTPVHDAQLPRLTPGVTSSPSQQLINVNNKVKSTDSLQGTTFHPANVANGSERLASTNGEMLTSADSANGVSNARAQPTDTCNGKDKSVSSSVIYHNPTKPLDDQPLRSSSTNKASDKQQLMESPNHNISSEQENYDTKNKKSVLADLKKTLKKHAAQNVSRHAPRKTLGSANNNILSDTEPLSSPSLNKTSNVQPMNLQFTSKSSEDWCKQCPDVSKTSGEKPTGTANTTRVLVHTVNAHDSDVPVDHTPTVRKRQSQSVAHLSAITTGTDLLNGQHSCFSLVNNKCTEMAAGSPSAKKALLTKEELNSREETPPTSPGIPSKASKVQNATCHSSPLHKEAFSKQLKRDGLVAEQSPDHSIISQQTQNYLSNVDENLGTSGGATSEQTSEHRIVSQTQKYVSSVDVDLRNSGQTLDESASPGNPPEDGCMHGGEDTVLLSGQTSDKPTSPCDLEENECMFVEDITHADEDTVIHSGFPASVGKPMNLGIDQKSKLMESYKEAEKQMSRTGDTTKDDHAKISSRTTSRKTYNKSDSDSAGSCTEVEDQGEITRDEDPDGMESESSQMSNKVGQCTRDEGHDKVEAGCSKTSSLSVKESSRDEDHNGVQSELSESSLESNGKEEICRGEDHDDILSELCESCSEKKQSTEGEYIDRIETEFPAASLFSLSASSKSDLILPENAFQRHRALEEIQLKTMKTNLRVLNSQLQTLQYQLQQQTEDGDAAFATNIIQFLRKVPEDKKLSTQMSILNVLSSVLGQQPMLTSNSGCVPQQNTNPSSPRLSGQPLPPKP